MIATDIGALRPTFDATAVDLQMRADAATNRIELDLWLGRILIVSLGVVFAAVGVIADRFGRAWIAANPEPLQSQ